MSHVRSFSEGGPEGEYLYTIQNKKKVRIGGPYPSPEHATAMSKAVSEAVGEGSIAEYKKWLSSNNDLFKMDTRIRGLLDPERKPSKATLYANAPLGLIAGVSPEDWTYHTRYSATKDIPWNSPDEERRAVSADKTQDLIDRTGELSYLDKIKLSIAGGMHQGFQGLPATALGMRFPSYHTKRYPNYQDYLGNLDSIWDSPRKKKKSAN